MADVKDWQIGKTLQDRLHHMLTNELMCDVTFLIGQERTQVRAHKFMLASASSVFYSMFDGPMAEQGDVTVTDLEVDAFKDILKFIYTDEVAVNATNIKGLMYGSDKYIIEVLKEKCTSFLTTNVDDENACVVLQTAYDCRLDTLRENALHFILKNGRTCLSSKSFLMLSQECAKLITKSDYLHCTEELVYEKMVEWSEKRCHEQTQDITDENKRKALGDLLYHIRFPVIDKKYFTLNISKRYILTSEEIIKVYQSYYEDDSKLFSKKRRHFDLGTVQLFRCDSDTSAGCHQNGPCDCLDFTTNSDSFITGIYVFGSTTYLGQHDIRVDLLQACVTLGSVTTKLASVAGQDVYLIPFIVPIRLDKNIRYSIRLKMVGPTVFKGKNYKSVVTTENGVTVTFQDSLLPSPKGTNVTNGQIPGICLSSV